MSFLLRPLDLATLGFPLVLSPLYSAQIWLMVLSFVSTKKQEITVKMARLIAPNAMIIVLGCTLSKLAPACLRRERTNRKALKNEEE